jgi:ribokinase
VTRVVVTGYAGLDHVVALAGTPMAGATVRMRRLPGAWPRPGGSPFYVAAALAAGGIAEVAPLTWVGSDAAGEEYQAALAACGLCCDGIATLSGATPVTIMAYAPDGGCFCLYDAGSPEPEALTPVQADLLATAGWVCVTVGPPAITDAVLDRLPAEASLAWAVKADPRSFSPAQAARLAARADLICHSRAETGFVAAAVAGAGRRRPGAIRVETRGPEGAMLTWDGECRILPTDPLPVRDPTGAGDTLVGGVIASLIANPDDKPGAVRAGIAAARAMLRTRESQQEPA